MKLRPMLSAALLGTLRQLLQEVRRFLSSAARLGRRAPQPMLIPIKAERRLRPGHPPGRYRRYE